MENYFIINPVSGKGKSADYIPIIKEKKEKLKALPEVFLPRVQR